MQQSSNVERPLADTCVMVTRAESPMDPLAEELRELGAEVVLQPAIRILPPADWGPVDAAIARLHEYDWLVFSSSNGVHFLLDRIKVSGVFASAEKRLPTPFPRVAAIGSGTAEELVRRGLRADLVPEEYRAEALADALLKGTANKLDLSPFPRRFLLIRASRGREVLAERLTAAGATVDQIVVYTSGDVERPDPEIAALLAAGRIAWITVTSSAIARSLARMFGGDLRRAKLASMSPITSGVLRELGHQPAVEAAEYTFPGLAAAILAETQRTR